MRVIFGNGHAIGKAENPDYSLDAHVAALQSGATYNTPQLIDEDHGHLGDTWTACAYPTLDPNEVLRDLRGSNGNSGQLQDHFADKPLWVESDSERCAQFLSLAFDIPVGRPADWDSRVPNTPKPEDIPDRQPEPAETQPASPVEPTTGTETV